MRKVITNIKQVWQTLKGKQKKKPTAIKNIILSYIKKNNNKNN